MSDTPVSQARLTIPSDLTHLQSIREFIEHTISQAGFPTNEVQRMVTAAFEAVVNAMTHGSPLGSTNSVSIAITVHVDRAVVEIADQGSGLPIDASGEMPDASSSRGRGIALMRALVDDVQFTAKDGCRVVLTKYRS